MVNVTTTVSFNHTYSYIPTMKFLVDYSDCYVSNYTASTTSCEIVVTHTKGNDKHNCIVYWLAEGN